MMRPHDEPALPTSEQNNDGSLTNAGSMGLSMRDWFAGQVLAGIYANPEWDNQTCGKIAEAAYKQANEMMEARKKFG